MYKTKINCKEIFSINTTNPITENTSNILECLYSFT